MLSIFRKHPNFGKSELEINYCGKRIFGRYVDLIVRLVARHLKVPIDNLHIDTIGSSFNLPLENNWRTIMKLLMQKTTQHKYGLPTHLISDDQVSMSSDHLRFAIIGRLS